MNNTMAVKPAILSAFLVAAGLMMSGSASASGTGVVTPVAASTTTGGCWTVTNTHDERTVWCAFSVNTEPLSTDYYGKLPFPGPIAKGRNFANVAIFGYQDTKDIQVASVVGDGDDPSYCIGSAKPGKNGNPGYVGKIEVQEPVCIKATDLVGSSFTTGSLKRPVSEISQVGIARSRYTNDTNLIV